jgi:ferredoxin
MSADPTLPTACVELRLAPAPPAAPAMPAGTTLLAAAQAAGLDLATGCRRGMCGTDLVRIRAGAEHLLPPDDPERGTLERIGVGPEYRLCCSARLAGGAIVVTMDPIG